MLLDALLELIPLQAVYRRIPLDARLNALGQWQEAAEKFVVPSDENGVWTALVYASQVSALRLLPAHRTFALAVLEKNAACLEAIRRGLERGQLQFPEFCSLEKIPADTEFASRLGEIARLYLIRFRLAFSEGDLAAAAEALFHLDRIGSLICGGEGQMLHYLIGLWLRGAAVRGFGHLGTNPQTPASVLKRILETLDEELKSPDGIVQSLRVDLSTITLAQLDRTVDDAELSQIVDSVLESYYRPRWSLEAKVPGSEHAAIADAWLKERRERILFLLDGHRKPFDKRATARLMGQIAAETIGDLQHLRRPGFLDVVGQLHSVRRKLRLFRLAQKTRYWPAELTPGLRVDITGGMGMKPSAGDELVSIQLPDEAGNEHRLIVAKHKLRQVENPIGLMLAEELLTFDYGPHLLDHLNTMRKMRRLIRQRLASKGPIRESR
jgi:hypothetical protein